MSEDRIDLTIANDGFSFETLIRSIYKNPEIAVIRELVRNALDAHAEAGVDKKVDLDITNRYFYVRDYGNGVSHDFVRDLMRVVMKSTKRGDRGTTGGHGLGCKTPFGLMIGHDDIKAMMISISGGVRNVYELMLDDGMPVYNRIVTDEPTDEASGVSYLIDLDSRVQCVSPVEYIKLFYPLQDKVNFLGTDYCKYIHVETVGGLKVAFIKKSYLELPEAGAVVDCPWSYISNLENKQSLPISEPCGRAENLFSALNSYSIANNTWNSLRRPTIPFHQSTSKGITDVSRWFKVNIDGLVYDVVDLDREHVTNSPASWGSGRRNIDTLETVAMTVVKAAVDQVNRRNVNAIVPSDVINIQMANEGAYPVCAILFDMHEWDGFVAQRSREGIVPDGNGSSYDLFCTVYDAIIDSLPTEFEDVEGKDHVELWENYRFVKAWDCLLSLLRSVDEIELTPAQVSIAEQRPVAVMFHLAMKQLTSMSEGDEVDSVFHNGTYRYRDMIAYMAQNPRDLIPYKNGNIFSPMDASSTMTLIDALAVHTGNAKSETAKFIIDNIFDGKVENACKLITLSSLDTISVPNSAYNIVGESKNAIDNFDVVFEPLSLVIQLETANYISKGMFVSTVYHQTADGIGSASKTNNNPSNVLPEGKYEFYFRDARIYKDKIDAYMEKHDLDYLIELSYTDSDSNSIMVNTETAMTDLMTRLTAYRVIQNVLHTDTEIKYASDIFNFKIKRKARKKKSVSQGPFDNLDAVPRGVTIARGDDIFDSCTYQELLDLFESSDVVYIMNDDSTTYQHEDDHEGHITLTYTQRSETPSVIGVSSVLEFNDKNITEDCVYDSNIITGVTDDSKIAFVRLGDSASQKVKEFIDAQKNTESYIKYFYHTIGHFRPDTPTDFTDDEDEYRSVVLEGFMSSYVGTIMSTIRHDGDIVDPIRHFSWVHVRDYCGVVHFLRKYYGVGESINTDHMSKTVSDSFLRMKLPLLYHHDRDFFIQIMADIKTLSQEIKDTLWSIKHNSPSEYRTLEFFNSGVSHQYNYRPELQAVREDIDLIFSYKNA